MTRRRRRTPAVKADPKKPLKAVAATLAPLLLAALYAALQTLVTNGDSLPPWVKLAALCLVSGIATYVVRNPQVPAAVDDDAEVDNPRALGNTREG